MKSVKELATHKATLITALLTVLGGGGAGVGIPVFNRIEGHVVEIKNADALVLEELEANYVMTRNVYITNLVDLYSRFPESFVDSILEEVTKDVYWQENN